MTAITSIPLHERGLPKWPQMIVTGPRLREDLALEIIRRTDRWFVNCDGGNDREGDRRLARRFRQPFIDWQTVESKDIQSLFERRARWSKAWGAIETQYVHNDWISCAFIGGPHGWCHPDGQIYFIDNVGKWPAIEEIRDDWQLLANAFPFLILTATLMSGECGEDDTRPVVSIAVADGEVHLMEPSLGDHSPPRRDMNAALPAIFMNPAIRERYPFNETTLVQWEQKALKIDEQLQGEGMS